jgi:hypothetical protein
MSFRASEGLLGGVVCPGHGEVSGEGEDLVGGQLASGVVDMSAPG